MFDHRPSLAARPSPAPVPTHPGFIFLTPSRALVANGVLFTGPTLEQTVSHHPPLPPFQNAQKAETRGVSFLPKGSDSHSLPAFLPSGGFLCSCRRGIWQGAAFRLMPSLPWTPRFLWNPQAQLKHSSYRDGRTARPDSPVSCRWLANRKSLKLNLQTPPGISNRVWKSPGSLAPYRCHGDH